MPSAPTVGIGKIGKIGITNSRFSVSAMSPALWLDAADTNTITDNSGAVSQWSDKSGNGYHVIQNTPANQPISEAQTINGHNTLQFDGSDDYLLFPNGAFPDEDFIPTLFSVFLPDTVNNTYLLGNAGSGGNNSRKYFQNQSMDFGGAVLKKSVPTSGNPILQASWCDGIGATTQHLKINDEAVRSGNVINSYYASNWEPFTLGSSGYISGFFDGILGEMIIFTRKLKNYEINRVGSYLSKKWNVEWSDI